MGEYYIHKGLVAVVSQLTKNELNHNKIGCENRFRQILSMEWDEDETL